MLEWCKHFLYSIDASAWVQTLGSFAGALLAGWVAISVFKRQVKHEQKKDNIRISENYLKLAININDYNEAIIELASSMLDKNVNNMSNDEKIRLFNILIDNVEKFKNKFEKIDESLIPYEIYADFTQCRKRIGSLEQGMKFVGVCTEKGITPHLGWVEVNLPKVRETAFTLKKYSIEREEILRIAKEKNSFLEKVKLKIMK